MSFLAPLYMLGLLAVSLPVAFHLIRRVPRGRLAFSSLMFLTPSPPRLTRRSRLDHLVLLLLRALVLTLLACAFARPFLRMAADLAMGGVVGRRVAILVDTSASMRQGNLWQQATARVESVLDNLEPVDDVALYAFDDGVRCLIRFEDQPRGDFGRKPTVVRRRLSELRPTWAQTDIGSALVSVAESMRVARDRQNSLATQQIVLIGDIQRGASIEALQATEWPGDVLVSVNHVALAQPSNASLRPLVDESLPDAKESPRVRVVNAADSKDDQFHVSWANAGDKTPENGTVAVYVPAGQTRVVRVPRPANMPSADRLVLRGDRGDFDNTYYVTPSQQENWTVVYVGPDEADDPEGLFYYLQRAFADMPGGAVKVVAKRGDQPWGFTDEPPPHLMVVSEAIADAQLNWLKSYLEQGGALLMVPSSRDAAAALIRLTGKGALAPAEETRSEDYVMLADVDFTHPVFAAFNQPRYSDFTKIHFWNHFPFQVDDDPAIKILARFDNEDPALWEQSYGKGRVIVLTSGWRPRDSQLALSSKFVPLMAAVLERATAKRFELPSYTVNEPVQLPDEERAAITGIKKPSGAEVPLSEKATRFSGADEPGIYEVMRAGEAYGFAVNLATRESDTAPLNMERLEQLGVQLGEQPPASVELERQRQLRDIELEGRQKIWRWLIALALGVVILETLWAGRFSRQHEELTAQGQAS